MIIYAKEAKAVEFVNNTTAELYISAITVVELFASAWNKKEQNQLDVFCNASDIIRISEQITRIAGLITKSYSQSHGTGLADSIITAIAEELEAELATLNKKHFPMVQRVEVPYQIGRALSVVNSGCTRVISDQLREKSQLKIFLSSKANTNCK